MRRQIRKDCCLAIAIALQTLVANCPLATAEGKPQLIVENPIFDFGTVSQGTKVSHEFVLRNSGNQELNIQRVVPACGCTAATTSGDLIAPGARGSVKVDLDTTDFSGEKVKLVRVFTNDSDSPSTALTIKGTVEPNVIVEPARVFMGDVVKVASELARTRTVTVSTKNGSGVTIQGLAQHSSSLVTKVLEQKPDYLKFSLALNTSLPLGELRERVVLELKDSNGSYNMNVPVFASIRGPLKLSPATISMGVLEGGAVLEKNVKLENFGKEPIQIQSIESSDPAVTAISKIVEAGKRFVIQVKADPSKVSRDIRATVTIRVNGSEQEPLTLNVYGILPPK